MQDFFVHIYQLIFGFLTDILPTTVNILWVNWIKEILTINPISLGIFLQISIILILILSFGLLKKSKLRVVLEYALESVYEFFEEILEESGSVWVKNYVVTLFFIILLSNLSAWILDWVRMVFIDVEWLSTVITIPTTSMEFNLALAIISVILVLYSQLKYLGFTKTLYEYIPIFGKNIVQLKKGNLSRFIYYPLWILVKIADIILSLFIGLLDVVGTLAKVISLAARLYGNMIAGAILLTILVTGVGGMLEGLIGYNLPLLVPLILYAQGLLVASIQAFVFPLLVGIFIKLTETEV